jgi:hypothetical protein
MKYAWMAAMAVVVACLMMPHAAESCGPFLTTMLFTTYHGAFPGEFESGRIGAIRPHYYRRDLLLAYRAFSGVKMPAEARPAQPQVQPAVQPQPSAAENWASARKTVTGVPEPAPVETDKKVPGSDFEVFPNCLDDAFANAAATLKKRTAQWGAGSPNVAEWVRAQDQVFQNCSAGPVIPPALSSGDALLRADRRYQIAAAKFYALQYSEAEAAFDEIGRDAASPWREIAPYLAARAVVRRASVSGDKTQWGGAATRLRDVLKDPARRAIHDRAQALLGFVRARLEPQQVLVELGKQLMQPDQGAALEHSLSEYTFIWDHLEGWGQKPPMGESDVADWIEAVQGHQPAAEKWRSKRNAPWLVAALIAAPAQDAATKELLAAARAVPASSPAYASTAYWGVRLAIASGDRDGARQWADQALAAKPVDSAANLFRAERLKLARDWTEFLRFAPRKPAGVGGIDGDEAVSDPQTKAITAALDQDVTGPFNASVPLERWMDATKNNLLPRTVQADIARAGWVRAVILQEEPAARGFAERVRQLSPDLASEMAGYLAVQDPATARFFAVFLMLRAPGFEPVLRPGFARGAPILERDTLRDNWWSLPSSQEPSNDADHEALYDLYQRFDTAEFLPAAERDAGVKQATRLAESGGNSVNYLASEAIGWSQKHPEDPRNPQALHLVVEATHYGPGDGKKSREYSKQAFDILHRRYPNSEWTKKTKYWY